MTGDPLKTNQTGTPVDVDDDDDLSAEEAFAALDPQERRRLGRMLREEGRRKDVDFRGVDDDDDDDAKYENPKRLARMTKRAKKKDPGFLGGLLEQAGGGGGGAGGLGNLGDLAKSALKKLG